MEAHGAGHHSKRWGSTHRIALAEGATKAPKPENPGGARAGPVPRRRRVDSGCPVTDTSANTGDSGATAPAGRHSAPRAAERSGDSIGPYALLTIIGQGGFGTVWLAERREPFVQRVALKIIKPGMDSSAVIERFEHERQSLALMDHPNIAKVLDGGITPAAMGSRPYFVMEHVAGEPITGFCDRHALTIRERLELFATVCDAVQHAHTKGIIHRDLKPSNILVGSTSDVKAVSDVGCGMSDGPDRGAHAPGSHPTSDIPHPTFRGTQHAAPSTLLPKVIDFGIAKAVSTGDNAVTAITEAGAFIGTPDYMSPEQAALNADIDTRSDVYSLGLVLYELLTGALPPERLALRAMAFDDLLRTLREAEPSRPSAVIAAASGHSKHSSHSAAARKTTPGALTRELRRELEWIPLMALRADRARRYQSAAALADDVRRYLEGRPLIAGPESRVYRARKFASRHRLGIAAAGAVVLTLVAGVAAATAFAVSEGVQRRRTERVNAFIFNDLLGAIDPRLRVEDRFERAIILAADRLERGELRDDPEVELGLCLAVGRSLVAIGQVARAEPLLERALRSARDEGRGTRRDLGTAHHLMCQVRLDQGRADDAVTLGRRAVEVRRREAAARPLDLADSLTFLGLALSRSGDLAAAERCHREALDLGPEAVGPVQVAVSENALANIYLAQRRFGEAEALLKRANAAFMGSLGPEHGYSVITRKNLAYVSLWKGDLESASDLAERALADLRRVLGGSHPDVAETLVLLASIRASQQRPDEEVALRQEAVRVLREAVGDRGPVLAETLHTLAMREVALGRVADALAHMEEAESIRRAATPPPSAEHAHALSDLGYIRLVARDYAGAERALRECRLTYEELGPVNEEQRGRTLVALGMALLELDRPADAEAPLREALTLRERLIGASSWQTANVRSLLGSAHWQRGKLDEAEAMLIRAAEDITADSAAPAARAREAVQRVIDLLAARGKATEAESWKRRLDGS